MANERNKQQREKLVVEVETMDIDDITCGKAGFITSNDLCHLVNSIMQPIFDDFHGSTFEIDQYGIPVMSLYFDHGSYSDDSTRGFTADIEKEQYRNETIRRIKRISRSYQVGYDQYNITQDLKDVLDDYIYNKYVRVFGQILRNNKGSVHWNNICTDISQPQANYQNNYNQQVLSKITGIDPTAVFAKKYGCRDENTSYDYMLVVNRSISQNNWLLYFMRLDSAKVDKAAKNAGIVNPNGLGIVR